MNSLAALSRAFSKSNLSRAARTPLPTPSAAEDVQLSSYSLPSTPLLPASDDGIKAPSAQEAEENEGPASAYPSPPPTPSLASEPLRTTLPELTRKLSKKRRDGEAVLVERAANSLPVRISVMLYRLIRRVLALLGVKIAEPPRLNGNVELQVTPPSPIKAEHVVLEEKKPSKWVRPKLAYFKGRGSNETVSPSMSRRSSTSQSTAVAPSAGACLKVLL